MNSRPLLPIQASPFGLPDPAFSPRLDNQQPGLEETVKKIWRRKYLILTLTTLFLAAGVTISAFLTPRYQAESQVMIGNQAPNVLNVDALIAGLNANSEIVNSEVYVATSRPVLETVAHSLNLRALPEFNPALRAEGFSLSSAFGIDKAKRWVGQMVAKASARPVAPTPIQGLAGASIDREWEVVLGELRNRIEATALNRSHVINIAAQSADPFLAARIANTVGEAYIEQQLVAKQSASTVADRWLESRIAEVREQVRRAEEKVEQHRRAHNLYETKSDTVIAQHMAELNRELVVANNARLEAETRHQQALTQLKATSSPESLPAVLQSVLIQNLRSQQSQLEQQAAQLSSTYTSKHPVRQHIKAQIAEIDRKIAKEARRIVEGLEQESRMAVVRAQRVKAQMSRLQSEMGQANEDTVTLRQLEREAEANRTMLVTLLQRSKETVGQKSLQVPDARMISRADPPLDPSFPPSNLIILLAGFLGFGGSSLIALLLETSNRTFRIRDEVENETGLPLLAVVPMVPHPHSKTGKKQGNFWDSLHELDTKLCLKTEGGAPPASVLFTSAAAREGKTSISVSYAKLLAKEGYRVVILELDWRRPSLHAALGHPPSRAGLAELLQGLATPEEAVYQDAATGLHAIFAGNSGHINKSNIWIARLRLLLATLGNHYDVVVLDTAPVSVTPEILHIARLIQQTVFVIKWAHTPRKVVLTELAGFQRAGIEMAGVVLSQVDRRRYRHYAYGEGNYGSRGPIGYGVS